jgi:hypothetical protein
MNQYQFQKCFEDTVTQMREMLLKKSNDYNGTAIEVDRLSNFKDVGAVTKTPPAKTALTLISLKVSRLTSLYDKGTPPENESVADSSIDLLCYAMLHHAILNETKYTK